MPIHLQSGWFMRHVGCGFQRMFFLALACLLETLRARYAVKARPCHAVNLLSSVKPDRTCRTVN